MRRGERIINYAIVLVPTILGMGLIFLLRIVKAWPLSSTTALMTSLVLCGVFLFYAKMPNLRRGKLVTFGISSIEIGRKKHYAFAYICLFIGLFLSVAMASKI